MKKILICALLAMVLGLSIQTKKVSASDDTLRIYNWQDYIDEGSKEDGTKAIYDEWKEDYKARTGKDVKIVYDTFATNEIMMNTLKTGKAAYDLVCPSEYTIQKMITQNMLEKYDYENKSYNNVSNYNQYGSKYLLDIFDEKNLAEYSVPYMWGTMGFIYNKTYVDEKDVEHWDALYMDKYKNKSTAKDSVRDTFVVGVFHTFFDDLMGLKDKYEKEEIDAKKYNEEIGKIMNGKTDSESLALVKKDLLNMKNNIYGFEVDNGKNDIATGKIWINFAWSGDAVYSLDTAEESGTELYYKVPEEGSNVWFDGWVMPKGANKDLAQDFVNYLCKPDNAARNMNTIGYTSSICGDTVWDLINEWYAAEDPSEGEAVDLTYLFGDSLSEDRLTDGKAIIYVSERGRQFDAQYPTLDVITRCAIMEDFGNQNEAVLNMWKDVKAGSFSVGWIIGGCAVIVLGLGGFVLYKKMKANKKKNHRH